MCDPEWSMRNSTSINRMDSIFSSILNAAGFENLEGKDLESIFYQWFKYEMETILDDKAMGGGEIKPVKTFTTS